MSEHAILARLDQDHLRLAQVLEIFEHQYRAFETDDGPDYELLRDILDYVQSFPDAVHHPTEDLLFDYLLRSTRLSVEEQQWVRDNSEQHAMIIEQTRNLTRMVDHIFSGGIVDGAALKLTMSRYLSEQHRHMEFENEYLFPLAEARLSQTDWDVLDGPLSRARDPLFDACNEQFEMLRHHIEALHKPTVWVEDALRAR